MDIPKKMIVVGDCTECPYWKKCSASKKLTPQQRVSLVLRGKFMLKNCPLPNFEEQKNVKGVDEILPEPSV